MKKLTYTEQLKDPRWQKKRLDILNRDSFTCQLCGDTKTFLHVHHMIYSSGNAWDINNKHLITCCEKCHTFIEYVKKQKIADIKFPFKIIHKKYPKDGDTLVVCVTKEIVYFMNYRDHKYSFGFGVKNQLVFDIKSIIDIL